MNSNLLIVLTKPKFYASLFVVLILCDLIRAPYLVWKAEYKARLKAEAQLDAKRCTISVSDPIYFREPSGVIRWRLRVHNSGIVAAANVQMHLIGIDPPISSPYFTGDYPYLVGRVDLNVDEPPARINPDETCIYEPVISHPCGVAFDNQSPTVQLQDGQWRLKYKISAENADTKTFTLRMCVKDYNIVLEQDANV